MAKLPKDQKNLPIDTNSKSGMSERQSKAAFLIVNDAISFPEVAQLVGVSEKTLYTWRKDEEFSKHVNQLIDKLPIKHYKPQILKVLIDKCLAGDVPAINTYFKMLGDISNKVAKITTYNQYNIAEGGVDKSFADKIRKINKGTGTDGY